MKTAFLFGGESNGEMVNIDDHQSIINMVSKQEVGRITNGCIDPLVWITIPTETYIKSDLIYRKKVGERSYNQMELIVFFHERTPKQIIESVEKIISLALNAEWKRVVV